MEFQLLTITILFLVWLVASHAALSPEAYWNSELPNTAMPKAVKDLLNAEWTEEKATSVSVGKGGVQVNTGKGTNVNVGHGSVGVHTGKGTNVGVGKGGVGVHTGKGTNVGVGKGGVSVHTGKGTNVGVGKGGVGVHTGKGTTVGVGKGGVGVHTGKGTNVGVGKGDVGVHTGKGTNVDVGKGGVSVHTGKGTNVGVGKGVGVHTGKGTNVGVGKGGVAVHTGKGTHVGVGKGGVAVHTGKGTNVGVGKGGVSVGTGHKGKPVHVVVKPGPNPFQYNYAASETQLHDSKSRAVFFVEKDLKPGMSMRLGFTKIDGDGTFLARSDAEKIPFSSDNMSDVLGIYDVKTGSEEEMMMTETVKQCEKPANKGEDKYCATSLESMVDFSTSKLGKNVRAISTEVNKETKLQKYTITGVSKMKGNEAVVCHKQTYPYAVFYCHDTHTTKAYTVAMVGADGTKANAVAVCHTDTSSWNPKHLAFQMLKVQPGTVPVCHFLPEDHIVWIAN